MFLVSFVQNAFGFLSKMDQIVGIVCFKSEAREAHELSRAAHWQKCERVFRRIPRRCELVWPMDGNARMGSRSKHREVWNCNGGDLFDILKEHHLKAANTFHAARAAQCKCQVDYDSFVNLSGYRDHRPVGLLIPRRRRWKQEQAQKQMFHGWDREHLQLNNTKQTRATMQ